MKKVNKILLIIGIFIVLGFLFFLGLSIYNNTFSGDSLKSSIPFRPNVKKLKIGTAEINVDLALTPEEQTQGLSGRRNLNEDEGMLFVFSNAGKYDFWMKDMNFPIDMIWIDSNHKIIYIKKDAQPDSYQATYGPDTVNTKYVLEVVSGFSDKHNVKVGDIVEFK